MEKKGSGKAGKSETGLKQELSELRETLQRVQAEFENSRKRMEKESRDFASLANAGLVRQLLPLLDSIDAAEGQLEKQENVGREQALEGIKSVREQLLAVLKAEGLEEIEAEGRKLDPMLHECVAQESDSGKEDGVILEEIQKGYLFNGRVLRHTKAKVNKL